MASSASRQAGSTFPWLPPCHCFPRPGSPHFFSLQNEVYPYPCLCLNFFQCCCYIWVIAAQLFQFLWVYRVAHQGVILKSPIPFLIPNNQVMLLCTPGNMNWLCPHTEAPGAKPGLELAPWIWHKLMHWPHMICTEFVYCTLPTGGSQLWLPCHIPVSSSGYSHSLFLSSHVLSHLSPG